MFLRLLATLLGVAGAYALYWLLCALYHEFTSPWRYLRGPPSAHWFFGNMKDFIDDEHDGIEESWRQQYGRTLKFYRFFSSAVLFTTDPKAIHHFLSNTHIYQKSEATQFSLGQIVGPGIIVVEGDVHKQQRKIMDPAFGALQVKNLTEIFVDKSIQLRDIWAAQAAKSNNGVARVEALSWLSKVTLDIIGLAGFNYNIDALGAEEGAAPNELAEAFEAIFATETGPGFSLARFLQLRFPILRNIPLKRDNNKKKRDKTIVEAQATMMRIGRRLLADTKREIAETGFETNTGTASGRARDLLTLLVRANTSKDLPATQRLSDEDVIAQVPTFLVAGHESPSTALTWTLFALAQNTTAQARLRDELFGVPTDRPSMDELNELPYLDSVVRETLRLYPPVRETTRIALTNDVVPLGTPVTDTNGMVHESLHVRKGEPIIISIIAMNCDEEIWGPDAMQFRPERWDAPPPGASAIPGVWGHMLTFLGGPRSCIGFRFALVEMKALIFTLVRSFEFELAVPIAEMGQKGTALVQRRPIVLTERAAGNQLPLLVRPVAR